VLGGGLMELAPYRDQWEADDPHANFKAEVAQYSALDPLPTLHNLSALTGIPVPCLIRYVLVKYAVSGAEALLAMTPIVLRQMEEQVTTAESADTAAARLQAYEALRRIIAWLRHGT
jgi:hypothetical protein